MLWFGLTSVWGGNWERRGKATSLHLEGMVKWRGVSPWFFVLNFEQQNVEHGGGVVPTNPPPPGLKIFVIEIKSNRGPGNKIYIYISI